MEIGGLRRQDFEVWVPFGEEAGDGPDKNGTRVLVRFISRAEIQEIRKKASVISLNRQHQKEERFDALKADILLGRSAVRGWAGFTMEGADYPYSPDNCDELMKGWSEFARFVNSVCVDLQALHEEEAKQKTKNSWRTSGTE